jgi:hypothetical protein
MLGLLSSCARAAGPAIIDNIAVTDSASATKRFMSISLTD